MERIIIYRSPAEAYFWESGIAFPLIASGVVAVILAILGNAIYEWSARKVRSQRARLAIAWSLGVAVAAVVGLVFNTLML